MQSILIIEDDQDINNMITEYLQNQNYNCTQAFSGSEGELRYSMMSYDLILLDLMLPGKSGEELIHLFAGKVPVIVLSAKNELDSKVELLSSGANDYICKPFDTDKIFDRFYKADQARQKGSSGLGLAIVKELVERMGGSVGACINKDRELEITVCFQPDNKIK